MKKFFNIVFVTLGVIFFIIILIGTYFFIADPLDLKPLLFGDKSENTNNNSQDANPILNESQEKALEKIGINPANVPSKITPEQEACFVSKIGLERVNQIKAGDSPTATEYLTAKDCI